MKIRILMFCMVCLALLASTVLAVEGQAAWVSSGKLGGAVSLNGDQCLLGVDAGEFDVMTLSLWLSPAEQMQGETSIFSCFNWQEGALHLLLLKQGHLLLCMNGCDPEEAETEGALKLNVWNHVALVYDQKAKFARVYINGKQDIRIRYNRAVPLELDDFCVGAWNVDPRAFRGDIDDVRIYRKAMNAQAIAGLYQGFSPRASLVLWWRLDEKEGGRIRDYSGKKHHGFLRPARFDEPEEDREEAEEEDEPKDWRADKVRVLKTETDTLLNDPLMSFDKILFIKRLTYHSSHFYTDFIDGCDRFGGNLCVLDRKTGKVTDLIPEMKHGIFGRFDLHFNADKVVFDWKEGEAKGFRIFEIDIDPKTGMRQGTPRPLTFPPDDEAARIKKYDNHQNGGTARMYYHQTDDMHPCYLPDGGIVFTSSRCEFGTLCDGPDHLSTAVLHRINGDGTLMQQLTNSPVSEFSPSIMEDGRILYTRWEYVDKGQLGIKCLWAMQPDGSGSVEIYGNDIQFPPTFLHGRQIPGQSETFVMLGTPHYPQSGIGTVIRVDTTKNIRTREPMTYMTPYVDIRQEPGWNHYENGRWSRHTRGPLYMDPYPLSDSLFMVAHNPDKPWDDPKAYG
ncbi:MAG: LamG domain-containing protein, partial [Planctomycetes bacterium]|nr:LamG domain-containing protein [Planctomycetota bacterium]